MGYWRGCALPDMRPATTMARPTTRTSAATSADPPLPPPVLGSAWVGSTLAPVVVDWATDVTDALVEGPDVVEPAVVVVAAAVVVGAGVVVGWLHRSNPTYGAATRPRVSPLAVNTALVSICPPHVAADTVRVTGPSDPAGITPEVSEVSGPG